MASRNGRILPLDCDLDRIFVGGKAVGLADAIRSGFRVPPGVVVPIGLAQQTDLDELLRAATSSLAAPFAVRSSGLDEDSAEASHAGQYRTMLSVAPHDLSSSVAACGADGVAVIVQEMVNATVAGVAFSVDPVSGSPGVVIEAVEGLAHHLLDGTEGGERWVGGALVAAAGTSVLSDSQATEVFALVEAVEEAAGHPVDVEWAFDDRQLWLLQVRPLSVFAQEPEIDLPKNQTWTQEPRFPGPLHRLSFSNWFPIHTEAFRRVFAEFGLPVETVEHRRVQGRVYSREVPFGGSSKDGIRLPEWVLALAMRLPPLRSRLAEAARYDGDAGIADLMDDWDSTSGPEADAQSKRLREVDFRSLDGVGLSAHIDRIRDHIRELAIVHYRLTLGAAMIPTGRLGLFMEQHLGWDPNTTLDLVSGVGGATTEAGQMLAELSRRLTDAQRAEIRIDRSAVLAVDGVDDFLDRHGHRLNINLTKPTLAEDIGRLVHLLLTSGGERHDPRVRAAERAGEARAALDPVLRAEFETLLQQARRGRPYQDASELAVLDAVALMRPIALEAGKRLVATGQLSFETDVWHLEVAELQRMLADEDFTVPDIVQRRSELAWAATHDGATRYGPEPAPLPGINAIPRRLRQTLGAVLWSAELEAPTPVKASVEGTLLGLAGAPGRAEGAVRFVAEEADFVDVGAGDIVVCRTAVAAWAPIFAVAGGIVTESGGALSHPATLAREYGVPAVMAVDNAMGRLPEGALVRIDGGAGTVTLL